MVEMIYDRQRMLERANKPRVRMILARLGFSNVLMELVLVIM
jgi:hypothetical protein